MARRNQNKVVLEHANVFMEGSGECDVIYVIDDQQQMVHEDEEEPEDQHQVYQILEEVVDDGEDIYEVVETSGGENYITVQDEAIEEACDEYTANNSDNIETIEIISSEINEPIDNEEIIYVTSEDVDADGSGVTFMQIGGPDVASEETIETSMIVEIPEEKFDLNPMSTDHCYTFKRGIKPKDLDRAKTKAAMLGETSHQPHQPYTFILPKNPTTQIIFPNNTSLENHKLLEKRPPLTTKQPRCSKHRWLWQFMKELLFVGDPSIQWFNQREGTFILKDQDSLAIKWECYKKLHKMKAQVWRQMRYYFGWMEENKIVRPVVEFQNRFQFQEKFYREKFLPYKFRPHADLAKIGSMAAGMDPGLDILSRYRHGLKEKVFCFRGCGSQFINKEACTRHESVCTFSPKQAISYVQDIKHH